MPKIPAEMKQWVTRSRALRWRGPGTRCPYRRGFGSRHVVSRSSSPRSRVLVSPTARSGGRGALRSSGRRSGPDTHSRAVRDGAGQGRAKSDTRVSERPCGGCAAGHGGGGRPPGRLQRRGPRRCVPVAASLASTAPPTGAGPQLTPSSAGEPPGPCSEPHRSGGGARGGAGAGRGGRARGGGRRGGGGRSPRDPPAPPGPGTRRRRQLRPGAALGAAAGRAAPAASPAPLPQPAGGSATPGAGASPRGLRPPPRRRAGRGAPCPPRAPAHLPLPPPPPGDRRPGDAGRSDRSGPGRRREEEAGGGRCSVEPGAADPRARLVPGPDASLRGPRRGGRRRGRYRGSAASPSPGDAAALCRRPREAPPARRGAAAGRGGAERGLRGSIGLRGAPAAAGPHRGRGRRGPSRRHPAAAPG